MPPSAPRQPFLTFVSGRPGVRPLQIAPWAFLTQITPYLKGEKMQIIENLKVKEKLYIEKTVATVEKERLFMVQKTVANKCMFV